MADQVEVEGLPQLQASLSRLASRVPEVAPPQAGQIIGREAVMRAPKRSGRLAGSFSAEQGPGQQLLSFGVVYAGPIHFGVGPRAGLRGPHNIRPNPYLFGAVEATQPQWLDTYTEQLQELCDDVKGA